MTTTRWEFGTVDSYRWGFCGGLANLSDQSAQIKIQPVNSKHHQKKTALFSVIFLMILRLALKLMISRSLDFVSLESKYVVIFTVIPCELTLDMFCRLIICQWKIWFKYFLGQGFMSGYLGFSLIAKCYLGYFIE